jgi:diaminohydroxyphosphoribosylaminopyrimidine deaminase / 5-amino-6-(5-phosphoribosylamino)uracil reductase
MLDELIKAGLAQAVEAAAGWRGNTSPNPPVGCVLLDVQGQALAVAAHRKAGEAHAEALAIEECRRVGVVDSIHTAVVTMEPCNHTGRTPPCSEALLATSVRRVVIGCRDPNPKVQGGGAARLAAAGIEIQFVNDKGCRELIRPFRKHVREGLPWVTVKQALTADGSMIPPPGQKTFTSKSSLTAAHQLRKRADAILTGSGTVLADDPHFTVRRVDEFSGKRRILVIMDRRKRVPQRYLDEACARGFDVWIEDAIEEVLPKLGARGCLEVLVEAGPTLTSGILESGLWDEHIVIQQRGSSEDAIQQRLRNEDDHS